MLARIDYDMPTDFINSRIRKSEPEPRLLLILGRAHITIATMHKTQLQHRGSTCSDPRLKVWIPAYDPQSNELAC